jgi:hypothetical protein
MSPALAFATPAFAIDAQVPNPGGGRAATYESAAASFAPSPLEDALAITLFIQPCIGQGFWPFAPQSNVFGPTPAPADPVAAAVAVLEGAAETEALGTADAEAEAAVAGGGSAAAVAVAGALALRELESAEAKVGFASTAPPVGSPGLSLPQPAAMSPSAASANRWMVLLMNELSMTGIGRRGAALCDGSCLS